MMFVVRSGSLQGTREAEALHGQRLVESLPDGRRRARVVALQRPGQPRPRPAPAPRDSPNRGLVRARRSGAG